MEFSRGVLVGADERQEWLLPWWWTHFSQWSSDPVCFVDFGLSVKMKEWCRTRGLLIRPQFPPLFVRDREEVEPKVYGEWEARYPDTFWTAREAWFKKPQACLSSPFEKTFWLDLDCQVVASIEGIWRGWDTMALAKDFSPSAALYNSGVIGFRKNHPLIAAWASQALERNGLFRSDQDLLYQIIRERNEPIFELSPLYNWAVGFGEKPDVAIYHWLGDAAKAALKREILSL